MQRTAKIFFLIVAAAPVIGGAQKETADDGSVDETIDEITVISGRTLGQMRTEIARAEDEAYAIFNDLNTDDRYDIICKKEARVGSQIVRRTCLARLYRDELSEATEDGDAELGTVGPKIRGRKHQQILREKMRSLASENQDLLVALNKRHHLVKEFEERRAEKYEQ